MDQQSITVEPQKGETAEKFKARIEETKRELAREEKAASKAAANPPATPEQTAQATPSATQGNGSEEPAKAKTDFEQWWEKKGFKSVEDLGQSYRELEREHNRKAQELRSRESAATGIPQPPPMPQPAPTWTPPPPAAWAPPYVPPPAYAPTPAVNKEEIARQYGMSVEDFERVAAISNDMAQATIRQELSRVLPPLNNRVMEVNREVSRQKELVDLMGDPTFKNPQVQFEMHRVIEENPTIFSQTNQPLRYAFDQALMRIARANIEGSNAVPGAPAPEVVAPSSRPPATAGGNGGGGGGLPGNVPTEKMTPDLYAKMPLAEKRDYLKAIGALQE